MKFIKYVDNSEIECLINIEKCSEIRSDNEKRPNKSKYEINFYEGADLIETIEFEDKESQNAVYENIQKIIKPDTVNPEK